MDVGVPMKAPLPEFVSTHDGSPPSKRVLDMLSACLRPLEVAKLLGYIPKVVK